MLFATKNDAEDRIVALEEWTEVNAQRALIDYTFRQDFPNRHRDSLKPTIQEFAEVAKSGRPFDGDDAFLNEIHPRAWDLLLKYGKNFAPVKSFPYRAAKHPRQPAARQCYMNSFELMLAEKAIDPLSTVTYVEGVSLGPYVKPMSHAWNAQGFSKNAMDWTQYPIMMWTRYFGIPFTLVEYFKIFEGVGNGTPNTALFLRQWFEPLEDNLNRVLETQSRNRHPKELPVHISVSAEIPIYT